MDAEMLVNVRVILTMIRMLIDRMLPHLVNILEGQSFLIPVQFVMVEAIMDWVVLMMLNVLVEIVLEILSTPVKVILIVMAK